MESKFKVEYSPHQIGNSPEASIGPWSKSRETVMIVPNGHQPVGQLVEKGVGEVVKFDEESLSSAGDYDEATVAT